MHTINRVLCIVLLAAILVRSQDHVITVFDKQIISMANQKPQTVATFPEITLTYSKAELVLKLEAPTGGDGDEWDRLGSIFLYDDDGQRVEIGRLITPFHNCPWTWRLEVTDYQLLFHGKKKMEIWIESWKDDGYQATVTIELTEGTPARMPVKISNLWNGSAVGYGNTGNTCLEKFFIPIDFPVMANTEKVLLMFAVTGHRFTNNTGQAAEFLRRGRTVKVNGNGNWTNELWQECGSWPVQPQDPGTWYHDRAGWCPGDLITPWTIDATAQLTPGQDAKIEYIADQYINSGSAKDATHHVESQLFEMRTTNQLIFYPVSNFLVVGYENEPLQGTSRDYAVRNFSSTSVDWTMVKTVPWLDLSSSGGTITAGASEKITVTLNSAADALNKGLYKDTLTFSDGTKQEKVVITLEKYRREMIGYWKFDEGSGTTAYDSSGNGFNGIITGTSWGTGKVGNALDFDRSGYVEIPYEALGSLIDGVTFCLWQNGDAAVQPSKNSVFEGLESGVRILNCHLPWEDGTVFWHAGGDMISKAANAGEFEGKWNHWAFTKNSTTGAMSMYLNGTLWHSDTAKVRSIGRADIFKIGSGAQGLAGYDGLVDEFVIYNFELPASTIKEIYDSGPTDIHNETVVDISDKKLFSAAPNPVSFGCDAVRFIYQGQYLKKVKLCIYDPVGNCIFEREGAGLWNLTNKNGRKVCSGNYLAVLCGINKDGSRNVNKLLIGVKVGK